MSERTGECAALDAMRRAQEIRDFGPIDAPANRAERRAAKRRRPRGRAGAPDMLALSAALFGALVERRR